MYRNVRNEVDIVIPIYNGYEDIQLCMDSIKKHTDLTRHRVLLINDCSPDERILPYLQSMQDEHIVLISNEKNMGFSANVNKGMQYSDRDVILLNSDTIVTEGWVEKIIACAYREPEIATVTPLSNSATLCSIPVMCQDNRIPSNCTIDELGALVEKYSLKKYPRITVAVGFCMFIKREVINLVGTFDAETYERGYGEENDFCNRAEQYGYKHVMCDDTFVYHKGTASFNTKEKRKLCEAHDRILWERYPQQMQNNHIYCVTNPDQDIRDNIILQLKLKNDRKNLLYVLQSDFREDGIDHVGGTQFHVKDLTMGLKEEYNVFVLAREDAYMRLTGYIDQERYTFLFYVGKPSPFPVFKDSTCKKLYEDILTYFNIQLIHIHHTLNHSFDLYKAADEKNIPVLLTMHDYYYVCPNVKLYDHEGRFCPGCDKKDCVECLKRTVGIARQVPYIDFWRKQCRTVLQICRKVIFPSAEARDIVLKFYPELKEKTVVIEHGLSMGHVEMMDAPDLQITDTVHFHMDALFGDDNYDNNISGWAYLENTDNSYLQKYLYVRDSLGKAYLVKAESRVREDIVFLHDGNIWYRNSGFWMNIARTIFGEGKLAVSVVIEKDGQYFRGSEEIILEDNDVSKPKGSFRVAFIGGLIPAKGSRTALKLIQQNRDRIEWYAFGQIGDADLAYYNTVHFHKIGPYRRGDISGLLKAYQIDLICILPGWAETFCYTLSEAVMNQIPVLVSDIGAIGTRVRKNGYGWVLPPDADIEQIGEKIEQIWLDKEDYQRKVQEIKCHPVKDVPEMLEEYKKLYKYNWGEKPKENGTFDAVKMLKSYVGVSESEC